MRSLVFASGVVLICAGFVGVPRSMAADDPPAGATADAAKNAAPSAPRFRAAPDSLMFTPDEMADIQSHYANANASITEEGGISGHQAIEDATLYLSTILYAGPHDWTIWINGVAVTADQGFQAFKVTEITPSSVDLLVPLSAQGMRPVHLQPNQTFVTKTGVVVEGKYP